MNCEPETIDGQRRCRVCHFKFKPGDGAVYRECPGRIIEPPSLVKKVGGFAVSAVKHAARGSPKATQEQIDTRLAICTPCEYYTGESCLQCGCACNAKQTYMNKLYHADQECPVGKWGKVDGV